jgi:hypothetical protein
MMEDINSSKMLVLTRDTWHNIPEDDILHSHHRENLKSYMNIMCYWSAETYGTAEMYSLQQLWQCAVRWSGSTTNAYGLSTNSMSPIFTSLFDTTCRPFSWLYLWVNYKIDITERIKRVLIEGIQNDIHFCLASLFIHTKINVNNYLLNMGHFNTYGMLLAVKLDHYNSVTLMSR